MLNSRERVRVGRAFGTFMRTTAAPSVIRGVPRLYPFFSIASKLTTFLAPPSSAFAVAASKPL